MKKIGIKYCGGCNENYDRIKLTAEIKNKFADIFIFEQAKCEKSYLCVLVICGCNVQCADISKIKSEKGFLYVSGNNDTARIIETLKEISKEQK